MLTSLTLGQNSYKIIYKVLFQIHYIKMNQKNEEYHKNIHELGRKFTEMYFLFLMHFCFSNIVNSKQV